MTRVIAFLRAINVGGSHIVKMDALREIFEGLGFSGVETFIASGNVIFETRAKNLASLEQKIEQALEAMLGYEVSTFLRTLEDVHAISRYEPFPRGAMAAVGSLSVGLLKAPLAAPTRVALAGLRTESDDFHVNGSELYWICATGQGQSKISNAVFERTLKVKATFRGLRTMEKLAAKYPL